MILNKYYQVLRPLLSNYSEELIGRELDREIRLSQKGIALALNELEILGILKSKARGNQKLFYFNKENVNLLDYIHMLELQNKLDFMQKNRLLANLIKTDDRIIVIFGSYATGANKPDSDIDMLIVGKRRKNEFDAKTFGLDISIKYIAEKEFTNLLQNKNPLISEIVRNHIIISGFERFIPYVWRYFYGNY